MLSALCNSNFFYFYFYGIFKLYFWWSYDCICAIKSGIESFFKQARLNCSMHKWSERNIVLAVVLMGEHEHISSLCLCRFSADSNQRLIRLDLARSCSIGAAAAQAWPRICSCLFHLQFVFSYQRNFPPGLKSHVLIHRSTASPTKTRSSTVKIKSDKITLVAPCKTVLGPLWHFWSHTGFLP